MPSGYLILAMPLYIDKSRRYSLYFCVKKCEYILSEFKARGNNLLCLTSLREIAHQKGDTMITVDRINPSTFKVTVEDNKTTTSHTVNLSPSYYKKLTGQKIPEEELIEKSFEFLLARESNTSILSSFDLPIIGRYFPEYENSIRELLK
jgi:hypothetical protein